MEQHNSPTHEGNANRFVFESAGIPFGSRMTVRLLQYSDLENALDSPERVARIAGFLHRARDQNTLVVGSGDILGPSVCSLVTEGDHVLDVYEHLSPVAETIGNHDFDFGVTPLAEIIEASSHTWLATNLTTPMGELAEAGATESVVVDIPAGRVGLVGVTTPDLPEMSDRASDVLVADPAAAIEATVQDLRTEADPDYVVVLSHVGAEVALADELTVAVDAILGGHVHDRLAKTVDGTAIGRPGPNGDVLVDVALGGEPSIELRDVTALEPDPDVRATLETAVEETGLTEPVATVEEPIPLDREASGRGESRAGNLLTDALRWATGADVGIVAARALRTRQPLEGEVTAFDLIQSMPFDDELVLAELSGEQLWDLFLELDHTDAPTMRDWYFGHVSGAELHFDGNDALVAARVHGEPLDPEATYAVATSSYYIDTDHIFSTIGPDDVVSTHGSTYEGFVEYARQEGIDPTIEGRIVRDALD